MRCGVIGTAGRSNQNLLSEDLYWSMVDRVYETLSNLQSCGGDDIELVSGGAAWADHVAVTLFNQGKVEALTLHFPCSFNGRFDDSKTGRTANYYHERFSKTVGRDSFRSLESALQKGAHFTVSDGFRARNLLVGQVPNLIAQTWSRTGKPEDGGTEHCWRNSPSPNKIHISLYELL